MIWYQTLWGDDMDGGRGRLVWEHITEPDDKEYIRDYVRENMPEYFDGDGSGTVIDIPFLNPYTETEMDVEINLGEWL